MGATGARRRAVPSGGLSITRPRAKRHRAEQLLEHHRRVGTRRQREAQPQRAGSLASATASAHGDHAQRATRPRAAGCRGGGVGSTSGSRPHATSAARSRSATAPVGSSTRVPKIGPVALISKAAARGASRARSSTTKSPPARVHDRDVAQLDARRSAAARREHRVEDGGLQRRDQEARVAAIAHRLASREQRCGALGVVAVAPEALLAVAVRHARRARARASARRGARDGRRVDVAHDDLEALPRRWPVRSLCGWRTASSTRAPGSSSASARSRIEARNREPLARDRDAILAPGIADVARRDAGRARELARDLLGRAARFSTRTNVWPPSPSARRRGSRRRRNPRAQAGRQGTRGRAATAGDGRERAPVERRGTEASSASRCSRRRVAHVAREAVAGMHASRRAIIASRCTFATIDAAAIDPSSASPRTIAVCGAGDARESCARRPARDPARVRAPRPRAASPRAPRGRCSSRSSSGGHTSPTPTASAWSRIAPASRSRAARRNRFESSRPGSSDARAAPPRPRRPARRAARRRPRRRRRRAARRRARRRRRSAKSRATRARSRPLRREPALERSAERDGAGCDRRRAARAAARRCARASRGGARARPQRARRAAAARRASAASSSSRCRAQRRATARPRAARRSASGSRPSAAMLRCQARSSIAGAPQHARRRPTRPCAPPRGRRRRRARRSRRCPVVPVCAIRIAPAPRSCCRRAPPAPTITTFSPMSQLWAIMHQVVDLRAAADARLAERRAVDRGVRADLDVVLDDDAADLRHLRRARPLSSKA